jgi:hypothetical protein
MISSPHTGRNAPNPRSRLSVLVDVATAAAEDARASGLHSVADQVDALRARAAEIALGLWRYESREQ